MRTRVLAMLLCAALMVNAALPAFAVTEPVEGVPLDSEHFPCAVFRDYVAGQYDKNNDGILSEEEAAGRYEFTLIGKGLTSVKGIEYFPHLFRLQIDNNDVTEVDVSQNPELYTLSLSNNPITSVDISHNTELVGLYIENTRVTELVLKNNPALKSVRGRNACLKTVDLSGAPNLRWLEVDNYGLSEEDVYRNALTEIDLSHNPVLETLNVSDNALTELDLSANKMLQEASCDYNRLSRVTLWHGSDSPLLRLYLQHNQLTELDAHDLPNLEMLYCGENKLTSLDISGDSALQTLGCGQNVLTELDVSVSNMLEELVCDDNQLQTLDTGDTPMLERLWCGDNRLTGIDVSGSPMLRDFNCTNNRLTVLDVGQNTELVTLVCDSNRLKQLDLSRNLKLKTLNANKNQLESLDVSANTMLDGLSLNDNCLRTLDLSHNKVMLTGYIAPEQTTEGLLEWKTGSWKVDLASIVGPENVDNVYEVTLWGDSWPIQDGILDFGMQQPETIVYLYDTHTAPNPDGYITPNDHLEVTVKLTPHGAPPPLPEGINITGDVLNSDKANTTSASYKELLGGQGDVQITDKTGAPLAGEALVGTGCQVTLDGRTLTVMIPCEVDGDGKIGLPDVIETRKAILLITRLEGVYLQAAQASGSTGDRPSVSDAITIRKTILGIG